MALRGIQEYIARDVNNITELGHTKDHHRNGTHCLPNWYACLRVGVFRVQPDCLKGRVLCENVYGDMHLKHLLVSIARVGYCISVPAFYLVLHGLRCRKSTLMDFIHTCYYICPIFTKNLTTNRKRSFNTVKEIDIRMRFCRKIFCETGPWTLCCSRP